ncbi:tRNA pseudouridine synthase D, putative, partial [Perkinsus marinus ATCC 50983]
MEGERVPEARGPQFAKFLHQVGVEEFIDPLRIGGVMKARVGDWVVREVDMDGRVAKMSDETAPEWWGELECYHEQHTNTARSPQADTYPVGNSGVDSTEQYRQAYEEGYWLGDRAANFIEEFCGAEALGKIVKFMKATREEMGGHDDGDYRRRLFEWKFTGGPADIVVVYKIRGAISGMLKESLAVVPFKLLSDKVIYYAAVNVRRNEFLLSCMDRSDAARVLRFFGAGYSSETLLVPVRNAQGERGQVVEKTLPLHFPDIRVSVYEEETESNGAVVELSWARKYSPVGLYKGSRWRFTLMKAGWDTTAIQRAIERELDLPKDSMHFAGVKDKFGVTYHFERTEVEGGTTELRHGMLSGNCFRLRIRDVEGGADEKVRASKLADTGFINYYGLQRFGVNPHHDESRHNNVDIGAALVSGDYEKAAKLILTPAGCDKRKVAD